MKGLFPREAFTGFGTCPLDAGGLVRPTFCIQGRRPRTLRAGVRRDCPRLPGVYGMLDDQGELIYVGKAKSLRARLLSYFRPNSREDKAGKIIREARRLTWEIAPSEFSALLRELELIRRFQPRFNVQGQPRRQRRCYICVGRKPAPYVFVVTRPPRTAEAYFGPFPGISRTREAVRRLNDWYRLRDCPQKQTMIFADQAELFPMLLTPGCLRHDIGHCLAPCAAACSRQEYAYHVAAVLDFLQGTDTTPLEQLEREQLAAAEALQFERAAVLRDRQKALQWLFDHLQRLRQAVTQSFIYPVENHNGSSTWYLIHHGRVRAALAAPLTTKGRMLQPPAEVEQSWARIEEVYRSAGEPPGLEEIDAVLLVASWFRRHRQERHRVLEVESVRRLLAPQRASVSSSPLTSANP